MHLPCTYCSMALPIYNISTLRLVMVYICISRQPHQSGSEEMDINICRRRRLMWVMGRGDERIGHRLSHDHAECNLQFRSRMAALVFVLRARYIKVPFLAFDPLTLAAGARESWCHRRRRSNYAFTMQKRLSLAWVSSLDMNICGFTQLWKLLPAWHPL